MKTLSLSRVLRLALICLVMTPLLLSPRSTSPVLANQGMEWLEKVACIAMDAYCDLGEYIPDWVPVDVLLWLLADPPKPDFQWNPAVPKVGRQDDTVISAVNVPTWFWLTDGSLDDKYVFRIFLLVNWMVTWSPLAHAAAYCFGDDNVGLSIGYLPTIPPHWYQYSSYDQSERTDWDDPAFEVSAVTIWKIDVIVVIPATPPIIKEFSWPLVPICKQKPTPVKQVESVLIP